jgi:hypothetical protein
VNILYLIFNRPHLQKESFERIRSVRPAKLFIAADGPRVNKETDHEKCSQARQMVDQIDWPCEVNTLFREHNLGCRRAVSEAVTWFFRHVDEGIVIEDDCVASRTFFEFAELLLDYYREDQRVWCISGSNFQSGVWRGNGSYYFSRYNHCWGWASWRRCWAHYDDDLARWEVAKTLGLHDRLFEDPLETKYWAAVWDGLTSESSSIDSWAYRWACVVMLNGGLTALPNRNLVTNTGFGNDGLHCFGKSPDPGLQSMNSPLVHPSFVLRDWEADRFTFAKIFGGEQMLFNQRISQRLRRRAGSAFRKLFH